MSRTWTAKQKSNRRIEIVLRVLVLPKCRVYDAFAHLALKSLDQSRHHSLIIKWNPLPLIFNLLQTIAAESLRPVLISKCWALHLKALLNINLNVFTRLPFGLWFPSWTSSAIRTSRGVICSRKLQTLNQIVRATWTRK